MRQSGQLRPVALAANQPRTFYRGQGRIGEFRHAALPPYPEDWVASTTTRFGQSPLGLSELEPGLLLADAIKADPIGWLGSARNLSPRLLVKLLDAGQRLPVHVHPDGDFARSHLSHPNGKTEAWIVLEAAPDATVHLGFAREVSPPELDSWVRGQDVDALLAVTNELAVSAGDAILCPAGLPHSIGAGIFLVELQEAADLSVLFEWQGFGLSPSDATLGLPLELALSCVDRQACTPARLEQLRTPAPGSLLPAEAAPYFRADLVRAGEWDAGFSVVIVTAGAATVTGEWGELEIASGATLVIPAGVRACTVVGDVAAIRCRPGA
jgi:mannose-6-phosphate isomerase